MSFGGFTHKKDIFYLKSSASQPFFKTSIFSSKMHRILMLIKTNMTPGSLTLCQEVSRHKVYDAILHHKTWTMLVYVVTSLLFGVEPLPELIMTYCQLYKQAQTSLKWDSKYIVEEIANENVFWKMVGVVFMPRHILKTNVSNNLTQWGRDKMVAISQTTFLIQFSWVQMFKYLSKFHSKLFPGVQLVIFHHWFR